mgnify:CR=1 FL=1
MTTDYRHPLYEKNKPLWKRIRDVVAGEDAIKAGRETYLPRPNEFDRSAEALDRYEKYLLRAVYYNATGRTLAGLLGIAYATWPEIKASRKELVSDPDGSGVSLIGQSQMVLSNVLQTGRAGLLADWTKGDLVQRTRTMAEAERAGVRAYINAYAAEDILTWEVQGTTLTRVVLAESHVTYDGGEVQEIPQLRELVLENGEYVVRIWRKFSKTSEFVRVEEILIGLPYIPFAFVGAVNNDADPDQPPLLDLANLNLAHYRNSADYEESAFLMGQPMLALSGVNEDWVNAHPSVYVGARSAIPLPEGGSAQLIQAGPNTLAKEAMDNKERQMQALGARMLSQSEAVKTATQSAAETKAAYSQLSLACDNVSEAYTRALRWAESWNSGRDSEASFAISTRFNDLALDANAIRETVAAWQAGLVPQSDAWAVLRRLGVIDEGKTDEQLAGEIEGQGAPLDLG